MSKSGLDSWKEYQKTELLRRAKAIDQEFFCPLCNVSTTCRQALQAHLQGKKHKKNEQKAERRRQSQEDLLKFQNEVEIAADRALASLTESIQWKELLPSSLVLMQLHMVKKLEIERDKDVVLPVPMQIDEQPLQLVLLTLTDSRQQLMTIAQYGGRQIVLQEEGSAANGPPAAGLPAEVKSLPLILIHGLRRFLPTDSLRSLEGVVEQWRVDYSCVQAGKAHLLRNDGDPKTQVTQVRALRCLLTENFEEEEAKNARIEVLWARDELVSISLYQQGSSHSPSD